MAREDMKIIRRARGILGKHFIDLDLLHISCVKGVVRILGEFKRLGCLDEIMPITEKILSDLRLEVKRVPDVKRVILTSDKDDF